MASTDECSTCVPSKSPRNEDLSDNIEDVSESWSEDESTPKEDTDNGAINDKDAQSDGENSAEDDSLEEDSAEGDSAEGDSPAEDLPEDDLPEENTVVAQRVRSARHLDIKTLKNRLVSAKRRMNELAAENNTLRSINERVDRGIQIYESNDADLHKVIREHAQELDVVQRKCRLEHARQRELEEVNKRLDQELDKLVDQNKFIEELSKNKTLETVEVLEDKIRQIEPVLASKERIVNFLKERLDSHPERTQEKILKEKELRKSLKLELEETQAALKEYNMVEDLDIEVPAPAILENALAKNESILKNKIEPRKQSKSDKTVTFGDQQMLENENDELVAYKTGKIAERHALEKSIKTAEGTQDTENVEQDADEDSETEEDECEEEIASDEDLYYDSYDEELAAQAEQEDKKQTGQLQESISYIREKLRGRTAKTDDFLNVFCAPSGDSEQDESAKNTEEEQDDNDDEQTEEESEDDTGEGSG